MNNTALKEITTQKVYRYVICTRLIVCLMILLSCQLVFGSHQATGEENSTIDRILKKTSKKSYFEQNLGQWNDLSIGRTQTNNLSARFYEDKVSFSILSSDQKDVFFYNMLFENQNRSIIPTFYDRKQGTKNYAGCVEDVPTFSEIRYQNIYDKIDLRFYINVKGEMEFDFIVHPGGNPQDISYTLEGVEELEVAKSGNLNYCSPFGLLQSGKTFTYQDDHKDIKEVESNYIIENGNIGFQIGQYEKNKVLIIDPTVLEWSTYIGGVGASDIFATEMYLGDDFIYICGTDRDIGNSAYDYPVTPGSYPTTTTNAFVQNAVVSKFDTLGNLLFSTYLANENGDIKITNFDFDQNTVFFCVNIGGSPSFIPGISANAFDTDLGPLDPKNSEIILGRVGEDGKLLWSTYLGGDNRELAFNMDVADGIVAIGGVTTSSNFPLFKPNFSNFSEKGVYFISTFDYDGNIIYSSFTGIPGAEFDRNNKVFTSGGYTGLMLKLDSDITMPITQNPAPPLIMDSDKVYIHILDQNNELHYSTIYNNDVLRGNMSIEFEDEQLCVLSTQSGNSGYTTPGAFQTNNTGILVYHLCCIDVPAASVNFATYPGETGLFENAQIQLENNEVYYAGLKSVGLLASGRKLFLRKFDKNGNVIYLKDYTASATVLVGFTVVDGEALLYANAIGLNSTFAPTADAAQLFSLDPTVTSGYIFRTNANGDYTYGSWISGLNETNLFKAIPDGEKIYVFGQTTSGFPTTVGAFQNDHAASDQGARDFILMRINTAPCIDDIAPENEINPSFTEVCINATVPFITGSEVAIDIDSITHYLIDGVLTPADNNFIVEYQWQINFQGSGNWVDISGATGVSHQPQPLTDDANFRRIAILNYGDCDFRDTSEIAIVDVNSFEAPQLPNDTVFYKCETSTIQLNVTAQGGTAPFTYQWMPSTGLSDPFSPTPTSSGTESTIYNVEVTDRNGCVFIEQYTVRVYDADAGDERINCIGTGVQIGTPHIAPGVPAFKYFWSPATGLSNANVAQPIASPTTTTLYTLTILGPDDCLVSDQVSVNPVQTVADAGEDVTYCFGGSVQIGEPNDPDYTYAWSPGRYLDNQQLSNPIFSPDEIPNPNPYRYIVTKIHNQTGCADTDTVLVYVNNADAGIDFCGPRFIGLPDHSNGLANFNWSVLSGDASSLSGQENEIQPFVAPSQPTLYQLQVEWNGVTCTDEVFVPNCGCLIPHPVAVSELNCPIGSIEYNTIISSNSIDTSRYNYAWTPSLGIPNPTSPFPQSFTATLTVPTNYTIRATLKANPSVTCAVAITIYPPPDPFPFAHAIDTITCLGEGINIGGPTISGWSASWTPDNGDLNQINAFDPVATVDETSQFIVTIEDQNSGCIIRDTAIVEVFEIVADAGEDTDLCENAIVQLGTEAIPGLTYSWEPSVGLENSTDAQPIDTLFATTTFYLTVSDSANTCIVMDTVVYTVVNNPIANAGESQLICQGGEGAQIGSPNVPGNIYLWSPATGLSDPTIAQPFANPTSTTTYTLTVSNNAEGCFSTDGVTLEVSTIEELNAGPDRAACINEEVMLGETIQQAGYSFVWSPSTGLNNPNIAQPTATITDTLTYTVTMTAPSGCVLEDQVTVSPSTLEIDAGPDHEVCESEMIVLGTPGLPENIYLWNPATDLSDPNIAQPTLTASNDILYTLTVTDANNCTDTDEVNITVLAISVDAGPDQDVCSTPVQIGTASQGAGFTYSWSPSTNLSNPNISNPLALPTVQTTYTVTILDTNTGCKATDEVIVTPGAIADAGQNTRICLGESIQIGTIGDPTCTYTWSPSDGLDNPNISNPIAQIINTITYTLEVSKGGCSSTDMTTVFVDPIPMVTLNPFEPVCLNECVQIGPSPLAGLRYSWSPTDYLSDPSIANPTTCPLNTITYTLVVTNNASGCTTSETVNVSVSDDLAFNPNAGPDKSICPTESTIIGIPNQNSSFNYSWIPQTYLSNPFLPQTNVNIPEDVPGEYEYILISTNINTGCEGRDTVLVTLHPEPSIPVIEDETICRQGEYTICADCISNPDYIYSWSPANEVSHPDSLTTTINPFTSSTFTLTIQDKNTLCLTSTSVTVFVNDDVTPTPNAGMDQVICLDESVTLGGTNNLNETYEWFPENLRNQLSDYTISNPSFTPTAIGEYSLWVQSTNAEGCQAIDTVQVIILDDATLDAGTSFFTCSEEVNLNATINGASGIWSLFNGPTMPNIVDPTLPNTAVTGLMPGIYRFAWTVNSSNVCNIGDFDLVTVQVFGAPEVTTTFECVQVNGQELFTYTLHVDGNGLSGTFNASGFDTHNSLNYNQDYGPFGPFLLTGETYELVIETSFSDCSDVIHILAPTCSEFDFGDLPDSGNGTGAANYETLAENNGPRHATSQSLTLANRIDSEVQGQESADALGDGDDEDAFPFLNFMEAIKGATYKMPVFIENTTSQNAYLKIWIDWNADGDFDDPEEFVIDTMDDGNGNFPETFIEVTVPDIAVAGSLVGFRARLSSEDNLTPYGSSTSGEVEDYLFTIIQNDDICLPLVIQILGGN